MKINRLIDECIESYLQHKRLNENVFDENSYFEKKSSKSDDSNKEYETTDDDDSETTKKERQRNNANNARQRKKSKKMASESLMKSLKDFYQSNKDTINLRGSVAEVYGISTDTTGSYDRLVKLNSKTRKVLAALNGEVREDNGIPFELTKYVALRLAKMWDL